MPNSLTCEFILKYLNFSKEMQSTVAVRSCYTLYLLALILEIKCMVRYFSPSEYHRTV